MHLYFEDSDLSASRANVDAHNPLRHVDYICMVLGEV